MSTELIHSPIGAHFWPFAASGLRYLNHGSFGAVPSPVAEAEDRLRQSLRANPFDDLVFSHGGLWNEAHKGLMEENRRALAQQVGADADGFVLTQGATEGVNVVLKSLALRQFFKPEDEILVTSQGYNACTNAARDIAALTGAVVKVAQLPFPIEESSQITTAILAATTDKTRLALVDHISSLPGCILPIQEIVAALQARGVAVLVDGAHALFQVPLALDQLGADFYVGNCHKWFCSPLGAGFLSVASRWRDQIRPLVTSHAYNDDSTELSPFIKAFNWTGTRDYSAFFVMREAADFLSSLMPGGWDALRARNHALVQYGQQLLLDALKQKSPVPPEMMGSMASVVLPDGDAYALRRAVCTDHQFVLQLVPWGGPGKRLLRLSAHAYNHAGEYQKLAEVLPAYL